MKKILMAFGIVSIFAACNSNPKSGLDTNKQIVSDTSLYNNNLYTDTARTIQTAPGGEVKSIRQVTYTDNNGIKTKTTTTTTTAPVTSGTTRGTTASKNNGRSSGTNTRRRGWSKGAKGAVIGGVGGAVVGAIVDKNHGQGAVIGGVAGATGGYLIGRGQDKKDGRIR